MNRNLENLISLNARHFVLKQEDAFSNKELIADLRKLPIHIYLICKSPKILLDVNNSKVLEKSIKLNFYSSIKGKRKDVIVNTINRHDQKIERFECEYPFNKFKAFGPKNTFHSEGKTSLIFKILTAQNDDYYEESNLEVLYVGQAFGKNGERITIDRLKNHEKAQRVYFNTQDKYPDEEVWFLSLTFEPTLMTVFDPRTFYDESKMQEDLNQQYKIETTPIPFDQQITILEASLITYFGTSEYNKEYLDFPSKSHTKYDELYKLDFNSVGFELSTSSIASKLFSKKVKANFHHYERYFLHNETERKEMLSWAKE